MGVLPEHCEKIMENVSVLRQSYMGKYYYIVLGRMSTLSLDASLYLSGLEIRGILVANFMLPCFLICYRDSHTW